jgi:acyl-CoA synthetase (AMP-forming)/AMP-acid ligase II/acyl carrier protein
LRQDKTGTSNFSTLVELLRHRAEHQKHKTAYIFLVDGEKQEIKLSYGELDRQARAIAIKLQKTFSPGERALLLYPPGLEFISAFFGCLYAGVVAVPCYPPDPGKLDVSMAKLQGIIADCRPDLVLTTKDFLDLAEFIFPDYPELKKLNWLASDELEPDSGVNGDEWAEADISSESLAFLQYTSGSTGDPKGVMVSHRNILYNEEMIKQAFGHTKKTVVVGWLPMFHDMGLIGNVLQPLYLGIPSIFISPIAFLQKPLRWLQAITRYKATTVGGPNFAYNLSVRKVRDEQVQNLDLSSLELIYNGAEPIHADTLKRFAGTFTVCGLEEKALYPCYGMAEATLLISGGLKTEAPVIKHIDKTALKNNKVILGDAGTENVQTIVGCGRTWMEQKIIIVEPETLIQCPDNQVGEIWVSGPNIAQGYWNKAELTERIFKPCLADTGEGPFLRTEDLGFLNEGELFVTGRVKDLIIIRGRNHYPHDIEQTVEQSHDSLRKGCCAAFSLEMENEERLIVVQEVKSKGLEAPELDKVIEAIRGAVAAQHELQVYTVVLIKAGSIPKTSSGKIQRSTCKEMFIAKSLKTLAQSLFDLSSGTTVSSEDLLQEVLSLNPEELKNEKSKTRRQATLLSYLKALIVRVLNIPISIIDPEQALISLGLDSLQAIEIKTAIDENLNIDLDVTELLAGETSLLDCTAIIDDLLLNQQSISSKTTNCDWQQGII